MKRFAIWLVTNTVFLGALWFGFFRDIEGARNIVQFIVWFSLFGSMGFLSDDVAKKAAQKGPSAPAWVNRPIDAVVAAVLIWFGWWFTATAYVVAMTIVISRRIEGKALLAREAK